MVKPDCSTALAGINLKNPVVTASGTFGYGDEIADLVALNRLGGIVTKTITLQPRKGNPPPRLAETPSGILNAIGLQNVGLEAFINEKSASLVKLPVPVIVSIAGESAGEYASLASELTRRVKGIAGFELNLSCPNLEKTIIAQDPLCVREIIKAVKKATPLTVIAKLSPQVTSISQIAKAAQNAGADALALVNTFPGMAIDITTWKPKIANVTGGLSGPAVRPMALRCVWEVYKTVSLPILAGGGISSWQDAIEFFLAGASAVSVGTANFIDPQAPVTIAEGITEYLRSLRIGSLKEIVGKLKA